MIRVSRESQDTPTGGGGELGVLPKMMGRVSRESQDIQKRGLSCVHPGMILGWSEYHGNPRTLIQGGVSCVHTGMILGWSKCPRKSMNRCVSGIFGILSSS